MKRPDWAISNLVWLKIILIISWEGHDENDRALGRGYASLKENIIEGRLYFHLGGDSWFKAERKNEL